MIIILKKTTTNNSYSQLKVINLRSTKMSCPNMSTQESIGEVLSATRAFDINQDGLILLDENLIIIAKFKTSRF